MVLQADATWVAVVLLVGLRVAPLFIMAPVFGSVPAPTLFRALLIVAIAAAIVSASGTALPAAPHTIDDIIRYAGSEIVVGSALAFGLAAAFAAFLFAGRLLDFQFGFSLANLIDPSTRTHAPLIGTALNLVAVSVFFIANGHHLLLRALVFSLEQFPPGHSVADLNLSAVVAQFGTVFTVGLAIAAPALFAVLVLDVAFAVASRTMPQMNVFIIAIPFKTALGIGVLALSLRYIGGVMQQAFESVFVYWNRVLA
jgi:flagellar biosynthesis protein FliR